jgi:hypothetical protein
LLASAEEKGHKRTCRAKEFRMLAGHTEIARPSLTNRSKVTNGTRLLIGVDGRSEQGRRYRDLIESFAADLGGFGKLSEAEKGLVRQCAALTAQSERMQAAIVRGDPVDDEQVTRCLNSQTRALRALATMASRRTKHRDVAKPSLRERLVAREAEAKVST